MLVIVKLFRPERSTLRLTCLMHLFIKHLLFLLLHHLLHVVFERRIERPCDEGFVTALRLKSRWCRLCHRLLMIEPSLDTFHLDA